MIYFVIKVILTATIIVVVTEVAKRNSAIAAVIASLPLISLLAFVWMRYESVPNSQIADLSIQIFWLVIPSLALFVIFWWLLRSNFEFWFSLVVSCGGTVLLYLFMFAILRRFGLEN
jgi:heme/copper-type cytochrome/quinol oxidase subunit 4